MSYVLITGASKGIGKALAEEFAKHNCNLLLTARSEEELTSLASFLKKDYKVKVVTFPLDLLKEGAAGELSGFCAANKIAVRVLVNNAGSGLWGAFADSNLNDQFAMLQLNQRVVLELCHYFIPVLKEMPNAHILNVASTAGFQPFPGFAAYAASKAFIYSFSRSLRYELKEHNINVSCLCPGPTDTSFFSEAQFNHKLDTSEGIKMPVEEVAAKAVAAMLARKAVVIPGISNKLGVFMSKHLPAGLTSTVLGKLVKYERKKED